MTLPIQNTPAYWTAERRARHAARVTDQWATAAYRQRRGILAPQDKQAIVAAALDDQPYVEIALDWLISISRVSQIACAAGVRRRRMRP